MRDSESTLTTMLTKEISQCSPSVSLSTENSQGQNVLPEFCGQLSLTSLGQSKKINEEHDNQLPLHSCRTPSFGKQNRHAEKLTSTLATQYAARAKLVFECLLNRSDRL